MLHVNHWLECCSEAYNMRTEQANYWIFHYYQWHIFTFETMWHSACCHIDAGAMVKRPNMSIYQILPISSARSFNKSSGRGSLRCPLAVAATDSAKHTYNRNFDFIKTATARDVPIQSCDRKSRPITWFQTRSELDITTRSIFQNKWEKFVCTRHGSSVGKHNDWPLLSMFFVPLHVFMSLRKSSIHLSQWNFIQSRAPPKSLQSLRKVIWCVSVSPICILLLDFQCHCQKINK